MERPRNEGDGGENTEKVVGADRVLAVLVELAGHPSGATLDELARRMRSPKATVHRALGSLRRAGLAASDVRGHYILGDEFLRLAFAHHEARPEHLRVQPLLERLSERFGETTHFAVLDGRSVVYRAKVDPIAGAVRLTSTIGGRNPAHSTAVGKALLSFELATRPDVEAWIGDEPLLRKTPNTAGTAEELFERLTAARRLGYAVDDQENEIGVHCLAVPVFGASPSAPSGGVSISALAYRTPLADLVEAVDEVRGALGTLAGPRR